MLKTICSSHLQFHFTAICNLFKISIKRVTSFVWLVKRVFLRYMYNIFIRLIVACNWSRNDKQSADIIFCTKQVVLQCVHRSCRSSTSFRALTYNVSSSLVCLYQNYSFCIAWMVDKMCCTRCRVSLIFRASINLMTATNIA